MMNSSSVKNEAVFLALFTNFKGFRVLVFVSLFQSSKIMPLVNKRFIKWKVLYFLMLASQGPYVYFLVDFYRKRGLSFEIAGYLEAVVPFFGCIFRPLACYIADRFALHRILLSSSMFIYAVSLSGFVFLSTFDEFIVGDGITEEAIWNNHSNTLVFTNGSTNLTSIPNQSSDQSKVVAILFGLRFLSTLGLTPASSLIDGIVYHDLEIHQQSTSWGRQRLWGSIGFSLLALCSSFLLDMFGDINGAIGFTLALGAAVMFFFVSLMVVENYHAVESTKSPSYQEDPKKEILVDNCKNKSESHFFEVMRFVFTDGHILLSLVVATSVGYFSAARDIYVSKYLEFVTQGEAKKIMGVMQIIVCALEIPAMFCVKWLFHKFGTLPFFATCFAAFSIRFYAYTLLTSQTIWFFLLIEILHIFCFALVVPAFTLHGHRRVVKYQDELPVVTTIMQGLISTLYLGLGFGVGSISGGLLTDRYGYLWFMRIFSITAATLFVLFCIVWFLMVKSRKRPRAEDEYEVAKKIHNQLEMANQEI